MADQIKIKENTAVLISDKASYNINREIDRDLSIVAINVECDYIFRDRDEQYMLWQDGEGRMPRLIRRSILEPLSRTGLTSIRYAAELFTMYKIIANDPSKKAVDNIKANVMYNGVENKVETTAEDPCELMYKHRHPKQRFTVVDLDANGSPVKYLDAAVQCVSDGGMLIVTATDLLVLSGKFSVSCYAKYGSEPLKTNSGNEQAIRILLKCISDHATRYGRYIEPQLSLYIDFYIKLYIRVFTSKIEANNSKSKMSYMYVCNGCQNVLFHPLTESKPNPTQDRDRVDHFIPFVTGKPEKCDNCLQKYQMGGPIWTAPINNINFVVDMINYVQSGEPLYATARRIFTILTMIEYELPVPLYYAMDKIMNRVHLKHIKLSIVRSAIMNAGYKVSDIYADKHSIKTNAPSQFIWDLVRAWSKLHPIEQSNLPSDEIARNILKKNIKFDIDFTWTKESRPHYRSRTFKSEKLFIAVPKPAKILNDRQYQDLCPRNGPHEEEWEPNEQFQSDEKIGTSTNDEKDHDNEIQNNQENCEKEKKTKPKKKKNRNKAKQRAAKRRAKKSNKHTPAPVQ